MSQLVSLSIFYLVIMLQLQQPPLHGHYTGQSALAGTSSSELWDVVGAKFYCPHALADGNQRIRIGEKTLEVSTVLSTMSPYLSSYYVT